MDGEWTSGERDMGRVPGRGGIGSTGVGIPPVGRTRMSYARASGRRSQDIAHDRKPPQKGDGMMRIAYPASVKDDIVRELGAGYGPYTGTAFEPEKRLVAEAGDGTAMPFGGGTVTPCTALSWAGEGARTHRVGASSNVGPGRSSVWRACTNGGSTRDELRHAPHAGAVVARATRPDDQDSSTSKVHARSSGAFTSRRLSRFKASCPAPVSMFQRLKVVSTSVTGQ